MPSIHRQPGRPYWFFAYSIFNPETQSSKRVFRSTKTSDCKQALEICRAWQKAALLARNGKLSVDAAREVIAQGVADVFTQPIVCCDFPMNNSFIVFLLIIWFRLAWNLQPV